jgi:putative transposase
MRQKLLPQDIMEEEELLKLYKQEKQARVKQRLLAIYLMQRDKISSYKVANILEVNPQSVRNWIKRYNTEGTSGLRDKPKEGRPKEISEQMLKTILEQIDKGQEIWTLKKIQMNLRQTGTQVSQTAIFYRLQRSGYSWKSGRKSHVEGDKEHKESFKKKGLRKQ